MSRIRQSRWMAVSKTFATALFLTVFTPGALNSLLGRSEAVAQGNVIPPKDSPALRAGQRVERPFGAIEISSFTHQKKDDNTIYSVNFVIRNENSPKEIETKCGEYLRLVADGVPRAPASFSCSRIVEPDSGEYGLVTFSALGRPHEVFLAIGTREEGRSYLRWSE